MRSDAMDGSDRPAAGLREPATQADHVLEVLTETTRSKSSLGNARADQLAGDPGCADSLAGIVGDDNFVAGNRPAEMHGSGGAGHPASCHRAVMCRVDVHPDRDPLRLRVDERAQRGRASRLARRRRPHATTRTAAYCQPPASDRPPARVSGQQFETHLGVKCAVQFGVLGGQIWPVSGRSHGLRLVSRRTRHNVRARG